MYIQSYEKQGSVSPSKAEPCEQGFSLGFSLYSGDGCPLGGGFEVDCFTRVQM